MCTRKKFAKKEKKLEPSCGITPSQLSDAATEILNGEIMIEIYFSQR